MITLRRLEETSSARALHGIALSSLYALLVFCFFGAVPVYADKVVNLRTDVEYTGVGALQNAVNAALTDDVLLIKGTVIGNTTITASGSLSRLTLLGEEHKGTLDGNLAGRVLNVTGSITLTIDNLLIQNGTTSGNGAGVNALSGANLIITHSVLSHNTSTAGDGGGVYSGTTGTLSIDHSRIYHNTAYGDGAGIFFEGTTLNINKTKIKYNTATGSGSSSGGGIYLDPTTATIEKVEIASNTAQTTGGAFRTAGGVTTVRFVRIFSNQAVTGGAIYNDDNSELIISHAIIRSNTASGNGGGIYNDTSDAELSLTRVSIIHNTAASGGGIYNNAGGDMVLTDTEVKHNAPNDIVDF